MKSICILISSVLIVASCEAQSDFLKLRSPEKGTNREKKCIDVACAKKICECIIVCAQQKIAFCWIFSLQYLQLTQYTYSSLSYNITHIR